MYPLLHTVCALMAEGQAFILVLLDKHWRGLLSGLSQEVARSWKAVGWCYKLQLQQPNLGWINPRFFAVHEYQTNMSESSPIIPSCHGQVQKTWSTSMAGKFYSHHREVQTRTGTKLWLEVHLQDRQVQTSQEEELSRSLWCTLTTKARKQHHADWGVWLIRIYYIIGPSCETILVALYVCT